MNLVSKRTIKADDPAPKLHDYDLSLTFELTQYGRPVDPDLAVALNRIFRNCSDGRYPFNVEMVTEALQMCIKNALYQCCQKRAQEKYGNEMVKMDDSWQKSRWSIEADIEFEKLWKESQPHLGYNPPDIKIERK
jgi:hypothetical protein